MCFKMFFDPPPLATKKILKKRLDETIVLVWRTCWRDTSVSDRKTRLSFHVEYFAFFDCFAYILPCRTAERATIYAIVIFNQLPCN